MDANLSADQRAELLRMLRGLRAQHKINLTNRSPYPLTTAPALMLSENRIVAQALTAYTAPGSASDVTLTTAGDIKVTKTEQETMGSFAIPITILILYFELNVLRNVSLFPLIRMFLVGDTLSMFLTLLVEQMAASLQLPTFISAGVMEEAGKVLALLIVINNRKYPWSLNRLLFGGAMGAGFAAFESAGYALVNLLRAGSDAVIFGTILLRAVLAPGGHMVWAALNGAALWKVRGNQQFEPAMLWDRRFLRVFLFTIALHAFWDFPWPAAETLVLIKFALLIAVAWIALMSFVQDGLKQIQRAQTDPAAQQTSRGQL